MKKIYILLFTSMTLMATMSFTTAAMAQQIRNNAESVGLNIPTDAISPTKLYLQCGSDVETNTEPSACSAIVEYPMPIYFGGSLSIIGPPPGSAFPVGITPITFYVTAGNGDSLSCTTMVIVTDNILPEIICPPDLTVEINAPGCRAVGIDPGTPYVSDNCEIMSVLNDAPEYFEPGLHTISWVVTDIHGNLSNCNQYILVTQTNPPVINCPANIIACLDPGSSTKAVSGLAPDYMAFCPSTLSYTMTGATTAAGILTSPDGLDGTLFNVGTTEITYTLTRNSNGISASCTFTVSILPSSAAVIEPTTPDNFCSGVTLEAMPGNTTASFLWSNNSTSQTLFLGLTDPPGMYTVTVSDPSSCLSINTASYYYATQDLVSSYTLLGFTEMQLNDYNVVQSGAVGLTGVNRMAHIKKYVLVNGPGSFVKADKISIHNTATVTNPIYDPAVVTLPAYQLNTTSGFSGIVNVPDYGTAVISDNYKDINIGRNCTVTLTGNVFGKIDINKGSIVTFTAPVIDMQELQTKQADEANKTYIWFTENAVVRVPKTVRIYESCVVNPGNSRVVFYIGYAVTGNPGELEVFPKGVTFNASAYVPFGQIHVQHDASTSLPGIMKGQFIANKVISNGKYVYWSWDPCTPLPYSEPIMDLNQQVSELSATIFPNPTSNTIHIDLQIPETATVKIEAYHINGQKTSDIFESVLEKGMEYSLDFNASDLGNPGIYFLKIKAGHLEKIMKLMYIR